MSASAENVLRLEDKLTRDRALWRRENEEDTQIAKRLKKIKTIRKLTSTHDMGYEGRRGRVPREKVGRKLVQNLRTVWTFGI